MTGQLNFEGKDKVEVAIERLKMYEPEEGYYLAFSGGKDSVTCKALLDMAGVKYDAHYSVTSVDPPELIQFVKTFDDVAFAFPHNSEGKVNTMWNLMPVRRMPPTRVARWCCAGLKEQQGLGRLVVTGVRWAESVNRAKKRAGFETSKTKTGQRTLLDPDQDYETIMALLPDAQQKNLNPIIDWTNEDVWEFIHDNEIPYCSLYDEGFKRLGCIGCPMQGAKGMMRDFEMWPKYKEAYLRAMKRTLEGRKRDGLTWDSSVKHVENEQDMMDWWLGVSE